MIDQGAQAIRPSEPITGWVCKQYVRRAGKTYGPYWYRFFRSAGKLHKRYIRPEYLEAVRKACSTWRARRDELRQLRRQLALARRSMQNPQQGDFTMSQDIIPQNPDAPGQDMAFALASNMLKASLKQLQYYTEEQGHSMDEALAKVGPLPENALQQLESQLSDKISWLQLGRLAQTDPEKAQALDAKIREEARCDLMSGTRASSTLNLRKGQGTPYELATFLEIRQSYIESLNIRSKLGFMLAGQAAQYQLQMEYCTALSQEYMLTEQRERTYEEAHNAIVTPRTSVAQMLEVCFKMQEAYQKLLHRTIKMISELEHGKTPVIHADQVNVGQQQVNIHHRPRSKAKR